ncbi:MAG TPA: glycosyltransferase family 4 protein [Prolixibacteraceae bacterium]|nr:glycosyltransferase family 4 protein [Prolixibacteraceae bacterium]
MIQFNMIFLKNSLPFETSKIQTLDDPRILFLLHIPPPVHGSSVVGLSIKESKLINKKFICQYINLLASQQVAESGIFKFRKLAGFALTLFKMLTTISKKRPKLAYLALSTTGWAFFRDFLLIVLLKVLRIKRVYHLHNKGVSRYQHNTIYQACYHYVFKDADVILLSRLLYPDIQAFVPIDKIHVCPNGIPDQIPRNQHLSHIQKIDSTYLQIYPSKKNVQILFLSNLIKSKGVFLLLEAFEILKKRSIQFEGIFIGGEGDITISQFNERVNQLNLDQLAFYQGKKYGEDKKLAFLNADIFAFPTALECFPLVLLEAMSYSLPIVTTSEGGIPDIVEDGVTGILMMKNNAKALADQLEMLIQNSELRQQMGRCGRQKYEKQFTLPEFENRLTDILSNILKKERHATGIQHFQPSIE